MKTFRFETCKEIDGEIVPTGEITPSVTALTVTEAITHPDIVSWCNERGLRIYKVVGK